MLGAVVGNPFLPSCPDAPRPNFVVFLTDDQRADTLWAMPQVSALLVDAGVRFTHAYSSTSECCPFRASFLSGGYTPSNTGVKTSGALNGGMSHFRDVESLPRTLQAGGYRTGFIGKYMHGYTVGYVPPGWSTFIANESGGQLPNWFNLANITYGSSTQFPAAGTVVKHSVEYVTSFHRREALDFIDTGDDAPFFLLVSMYAHHWPATPLIDDASKFRDYHPDNPAYREADLTDKPQWVQALAAPIFARPCTGFLQPSLQTTQAVDRLVADVIAAVQQAGGEQRTYFFFLSDNGILWGEHRLPCDKGMAYEPAVRVPLVVKGPSADTVSSATEVLVAAELDVPSTILDLAGEAAAGDGRSLAGFLRGGHSVWRDSLHLENYGYLEGLPGGSLWQALRVRNQSGNWKYVEYGNGELELYDLDTDPNELENLASVAALRRVRRALRDQLAPRKGLAILTTDLAAAEEGIAFEKRLHRWGGISPRRWTIAAGSLPPGIRLGLFSGSLFGTPTKPGLYTFTVVVEDSGIAAHSLRPQRFSRQYSWQIGPAGPG
ncbi:MAG TPA: sulfatase-like hydrolase/transferase [Candidatus Binatia bacterium]|nr:sulfatase-like hydrolase/transferase [Candidatus Binatia bacterium]